MIHLSWKRQIFADSAGSGSNLNCSYLIVCYLFFPKIISRYISICLIIETPKSFPRFNHYLGTVIPAVLTAFWNGHKNFKKIKNLENLRIVSLYVAKFPGKIIKLVMRQLFKKKCSQKRAITCGDQWLSSQMINLMATFMA